MRQALLLYAAQAHALIKNTAPTRLTKTRAAPQGWEDLSNGKGACCVRRLTPPNKGPKPPPGAECSVRWTAWLAEKQGTWWCRGERIGALQPNSTLEFTLGGGSGEATRAWDACVATMAVDDRVEILAGPDWAFGDGAEPHVPSKAHIVFELELLSVRDWAAGVEVFGADRVDDDDDDVLRRELELAAERRERGDVREETVEEKALLDDMEEDLLDDVVPDDKEPELQTYWPTGGSIDGETPERWLWRETPARMEVDVKLPRAAPSAKAMKVEFGSQKLSVSLEDDAVVSRTLEGPVVASECTWALSEDRTCLEVILAKRIDDQEAVWARPFRPSAEESV